MKARVFETAFALSVLALVSSGCANTMMLEFNGRTIQVNDLKQATLARGLEVTYFDGHLMKLNGRESVNVNGKELTVNGTNISHGASKHVLAPQQKLIIETDGQLRIADKEVPGSKSWWEFWK
jgi:hypothetical protein